MPGWPRRLPKGPPRSSADKPVFGASRSRPNFCDVWPRKAASVSRPSGRFSAAFLGRRRFDADPAVAQSVDDRLSAVVDLELAQDRADVVLDRLVADAQLAADDLVTVAARHQVQDLDLAWRKLDEQRPQLGILSLRRSSLMRRRRSRLAARLPPKLRRNPRRSS